jgi:hypothetical protein
MVSRAYCSSSSHFGLADTNRKTISRPGFAFDGSASISKPASSSGTVQFCMELSSPANLWSGKSLQVRRAQPRNDFLLKTSMAFLIRSGYAIESSSVKYDGTKETSYITLKL